MQEENLLELGFVEGGNKVYEVVASDTSKIGTRGFAIFEQARIHLLSSIETDS
jgi:hypothetical protein